MPGQPTWPWTLRLPPVALLPPLGDCLGPVDRAGELAVDRGGGVGVVAEVDGGERAFFPA